MNSLVKKAIAECLGTFVLVFFACGVAALTQGDLVPTALTFGLVIVAMAYSVGRISGCHINPAVSLGCLITRRMSLIEFVVYVCAQLVGALIGALLLFGILRANNYNFIVNCTFANVTEFNWMGDASNYAINKYDVAGTFGALGVEIILTFIFVYVILNVTDEKAKTSKIAGIVIGLTLTLVHLIGIRLTGTSVNPARSIATAISTAIYGGGTEALKQVWIFILAPLAGSALAALVYILLHKDNAVVSEDSSDNE